MAICHLCSCYCPPPLRLAPTPPALLQRANRNKLNNWDCEYQLFRKELEDSDDLRLSVKMFHACLADKKQFCADVPAGKAMAKQCLEEHREELSSKCRDEIDTMIERRVRDFRLDSRLKKACQRDIGNICAWGGDMESMDTYDDTSECVAGRRGCGRSLCLSFCGRCGRWQSGTAAVGSATGRA